MPEPTTSTGAGRVLVFVYGIFAASATCRALVQLITKADEAPLAYSLSLFSGVVYCLATWALVNRRRTVALVSIVIEAIGVIAVGLLTMLDAADFPDETVWSGFGQGYGYVPLILPFLGLWWLLRGSRR